MGFCYLDLTSLKTATSLIQKRKGKIKNLQTVATEPLRYSQGETQISEDHNKAIPGFAVQTLNQEQNGYVTKITRLT